MRFNQFDIHRLTALRTGNRCCHARRQRLYKSQHENPPSALDCCDLYPPPRKSALPVRECLPMNAVVPAVVTGDNNRCAAIASILNGAQFTALRESPCSHSGLPSSLAGSARPAKRRFQHIGQSRIRIDRFDGENCPRRRPLEVHFVSW
jgi:hypothetical protein